MNWIEEKLYEERWARRLAAWCVVIFFALLAAWTVWARRDAPGRLDSRAALEAFCQKDGGPDAAFAYEQAEYLGECTLTQTQMHTLSLMGAGYIEAPVGTSGMAPSAMSLMAGRASAGRLAESRDANWARVAAAVQLVTAKPRS